MCRSDRLRATMRLGGRVALCTTLLLASWAALAPASAKPLAQPGVSESQKRKAIRTEGDKAQRINETRQRRWDTKMKAVSGSICNGC